MSDLRQWSVTTDDIDAVLIPLGTPVVIPKGTRVAITQHLGGSYTVEVGGNLARVDRSQADALGLERDPERPAPPAERSGEDDGPEAADEQRIREALKSCYDPEIPVNIVDLGLVYDIHLIDDDHGKRVAEITMTLTAPGCGMGPFIVEDVRSRVQALPGIDDVRIDLVFDPPWDRSMMSDAAKLQLGIF